MSTFLNRSRSHPSVVTLQGASAEPRCMLEGSFVRTLWLVAGKPCVLWQHKLNFVEGSDISSTVAVATHPEA